MQVAKRTDRAENDALHGPSVAAGGGTRDNGRTTSGGLVVTAEHYDLIIRNAVIVDGTRAPRFEGEIGITAGRIAKVGRLNGAKGEREIDAGGHVAAPGFIDAHTHDDRLLLSSPDMS